MNVLVLNGSPSGENSITLYTAKYLEKMFPACMFTTLHVGQRIRAIEKDFSEAKKLLESAELILFCYPVYTFLVPAQLHRFVELMKACGVDFSQKYAAQISTSKHFYDVTAHRFLADNCADLGLKYLGGLSADMDDLLEKKGRHEAKAFFSRVLWAIENGVYEPSQNPPVPDGWTPARLSGDAKGQPQRNGQVVIVADYDETEQSPLSAMIERFRAALPMETKLVNIRTFPFAGGCLGCFRCAADGTCVYRDGFDAFLREQIQSADAIVYAYTIRDHSMGYRFKLYDDRQFCNGHRTVTMGRPVGYLVDGPLDWEPNLRMLMEARAQVGGNHLAGIATDQTDPAGEIDALAASLTYAIEHRYQQPQNFYGVGGLKIFRDLIWQMQGLMREDHRFYKAHGFYDFPPEEARADALDVSGRRHDAQQKTAEEDWRADDGGHDPAIPQGA